MEPILRRRPDAEPLPEAASPDTGSARLERDETEPSAQEGELSAREQPGDEYFEPL